MFQSRCLGESLIVDDEFDATYSLFQEQRSGQMKRVDRSKRVPLEQFVHVVHECWKDLYDVHALHVCTQALE